MKFTKRTALGMCFKSVITMGLYTLYYNFHTAFALRKHGAKIPVYWTIFWYLFLGLLALVSKEVFIFKLAVFLYFWYKYLKAYCAIVEQDTNVRNWTICKRFILWSLLLYPFALPAIFLPEEYAIVSISIFAIGLGYLQYVFIQKGLNDFAEQPAQSTPEHSEEHYE